jgi:hypothetical protein
MDFISNEKNKVIRVVKEGIFVGILTVLVGYVASYLVKPYFKIDLPDICRQWNSKKIMEWTLFLTGFLLHVFLEVTNIKYAICNI